MEHPLTRPVQEAMRRFRERLAARFGDRLAELRVFGSQARGLPQADSDVDVLVLVRDLDWRESRVVTDIAFDVERELGFELAISPFIRTPEAFAELLARERLIALDIEAEGVQV